MKRTLVITTLFLSFALAACGGKSKPADTAGGGGEAAGKVAGGCCCEFVEETMMGDGSEDTVENQVRRMMSAQECEENSGTCVAAADQNECEAGAMEEGGAEETGED